MRRFFFDLLNSLDKLTGMKQMEKLQSMDNPEKEIAELLDILCRVSDQFPIIPKNAQQSIISQAVIADPEFKGLNAHIIYKWLVAHKDRYFKEAAHTPSEQDANWKPVEGEQRRHWLDKWKESLAGFEANATQSHVQELVSKLPPKEKGINYPSTKAEDVIARSLHIEYLKEMNASGLPREQWPLEQTWINNKKV
jgi:hypothetical protein